MLQRRHASHLLLEQEFLVIVHSGQYYRKMPSPQNTDFTRCPLCGQHNQCAMTPQSDNSAAKQHPTCWCMQETFPEDLKTRLQHRQADAVCICAECLHNYQENQHEQ